MTRTIEETLALSRQTSFELAVTIAVIKDEIIQYSANREQVRDLWGELREVEKIAWLEKEYQRQTIAGLTTRVAE